MDIMQILGSFFPYGFGFFWEQLKFFFMAPETLAYAKEVGIWFPLGALLGLTVWAVCDGLRTMWRLIWNSKTTTAR